jgi:hypothetical protein
MEGKLLGTILILVCVLNRRMEKKPMKEKKMILKK